MTRRQCGKWMVAVVALSLSGLVLGGCGGGSSGGGGGGGSGVLLSVSFLGFPTAPPVGPNATVNLPEVFLDQTVEFTFDGPIDDGIFGGFLLDPATGDPEVLVGVAPNSLGGIPYYGFVNQGSAAQSLQIRQNAIGGPFLPSYIVGRHKDKPNTLVIDPKVGPTNPFGLPFSAGYQPQTEYVYVIPTTNGITFGGNPAQPVGVNPLTLPLIIPPFSPQPSLSTLFRSGTAIGPDPIPPEVVSIQAASGASGTAADPIAVDDSIIVTFSKAVDPLTVDVLSNFTVENLDLQVLVPGNGIAFDPGQTVATFTPNPGYGPGVDPTGGIGFSIEVTVGSLGMPQIPPILGVPSGPPPSTQLPLANSLQRNFITAPTPGAPAAITVVEDYTTTDKEDTSFTPSFAPVVWGTDSSMPARLLGQPISGSALSTFLTGSAGPGLGTRVQVTVTPQPLGTVPGPGPAGLISPFDDNLGNCLTPPGGTTCVNPNGGAHIQHGYEAVDLTNITSSLELVEWGPVQNFVTGTTYPQYQAWCGMTSFTFPMSPLTGGTGGLSAIYTVNYDLPTNQIPDPNGQGGVAVTLGAGNYNTGAGAITASGYYPFPTFDPPFDYWGSGTNQGNLVLEFNIEPGNQVANFNRYRASANTPVRRLVSQALSSGVTTAQATGFDIYDMRFTFVDMESSGQSTFYDTQVPPASAANTTYVGITLNPDPSSQPAGTTALWEFEAASALVSPTQPALGTNTGFLIYWNPITGAFDPSILNTMQGRKFFRYRIKFRNNAKTNGYQNYSSLIAAITF